jgi:hypothetical protein
VHGAFWSIAGYSTGFVTALVHGSFWGIAGHITASVTALDKKQLLKELWIHGII